MCVRGLAHRVDNVKEQAGDADASAKSAATDVGNDLVQQHLGLQDAVLTC